MLAGAITLPSSCVAVRYITSFVVLPSTTFLYGASIKPKSFTFVKVERVLISPIFCPSGVSIGQILP